VNLLGANARFDVQEARGWPAYIVAGKLTSGSALVQSGTIQQIRGGASLTERDALWAASLAAARHRPLTGYGPGTDAAAIAPYLGPAYAAYTGISSHSAWLRTAVEMGVPAVFLLAAIWVAALGLSLTALRRRPDLVRSGTVVVLMALAIAFLTDQTFEVYLFGGLGLPNLLTAVALGMVAAARGHALDV
jgi:O-antigen ligase